MLTNLFARCWVRFQVLVEPLNFELGGLGEALAVDAVVGDALDDVVARRHASLLDILVNLLHDRVVTQLLLLRDHEQGRHLDLGRRLHGVKADGAGRVRPHVLVAGHFAAEFARLERHWLGFTAGLFGRQRVGRFLGLRAATAHPGHLSDDALHSRIIARHPRHQPAPVTGTDDADFLRIHARLAPNKTDGGADVLGLVGVVHLPAGDSSLDRYLTLLARLGQGFERHQFAITVTPATVVEGEEHVPALDEMRCQLGRRALAGAAGAVAEDHRRSLFVLVEVGRDVQVALHLDPVAEDGDGLLLRPLGERFGPLGVGDAPARKQ